MSRYFLLSPNTQWAVSFLHLLCPSRQTWSQCCTLNMGVTVDRSLPCNDQRGDETFTNPQVYEYNDTKQKKKTFFKWEKEREREKKPNTVRRQQQWTNNPNCHALKQPWLGVTFLRECRVKSWVGWVQGHSADRTPYPDRGRGGGATIHILHRSVE